MVELIVWILAIAIMFVPTILAFRKELKYRWLCLALNVMLGWFVIPWFILLAWSLFYKTTA